MRHCISNILISSLRGLQFLGGFLFLSTGCAKNELDPQDSLAELRGVGRPEILLDAEQSRNITIHWPHQKGEEDYFIYLGTRDGLPKIWDSAFEVGPEPVYHFKDLDMHKTYYFGVKTGMAHSQNGECFYEVSVPPLR